MIWGCITWYGVGTLCQVNGNINAEKYISVWDSQLWSVIVRHFRGDSYVFQDDNAPVHKARIVERYKHDNNIHGMVWSSQSPDINVFCFVQNFFFGQHKSSNINFFCRAKREFFFQNLALGCMTKTLNQIIFFFLHQNQNIFFSNIGNQNIFLEKNHNPPSS